jgi:hypothetical protein
MKTLWDFQDIPLCEISEPPTAQLLDQRQHPQRAAAAVDDLERRGENHGSRRRELVEIAEAGEAE